MTCPECEGDHNVVTDTVHAHKPKKRVPAGRNDGDSYRQNIPLQVMARYGHNFTFRRRRCEICGHNFQTVEYPVTHLG